MADTFKKLSRKVDSEVVIPLQEVAIGRKLMSRNPKISGKGVWNVDVTELSDMSDAHIDFELPDGDTHRDAIGASITNVKCPVLHKGYKIPRAEFDSFADKNIMIDTEAAISAAMAVGHEENSLLIDGFAWDGTNYDIEGLYQSAGNTDATSNDFATAGNALAEVAILKGLLAEDKIYGMNYNLTLHPTQFAQLDGNVLDSGEDEFSAVLRKLNPVKGGAPGEIMQTTDITAGTCMLTPVDPARRFFEYYEPQAIRNVIGEDSKVPGISPIYGTTFEVVLPHIKHEEAIATGTGV